MAAFGNVAQEIAQTSSKAAKVRLLAGYLAGLRGESLCLAARYFGGRPFPSWDQRVVGIGGATFFHVLRDVSGASDEALVAAFRRTGDGGEAAYDVLGLVLGDGGVELTDVDLAFDQIACARGIAARQAAFADLLRRCSALEAKYVCKLMTGELRIGLREGLVEEAIGVAFAQPAAAVSRANMVAGDLGRVAILASANTLDDATPVLFAPMRFMLASPVADSDEVISRLGDVVWVEDKYDGIRCQLHRDDSRIELYSRDLKTITAQFPEIAEAAAALPFSQLILDGEVLAFRDNRVMPFAALQTRLGRKSPSAAVRQEVPVIYVAWDVLMVDGDVLLDTPLRDRRRRLEEMKLGDIFALAHLTSVTGATELDAVFDAARARLNEGLMVKDPASPYLPGRRGLHWLKLKRPLDTLDVVVTGAQWGYGKRHGVLSDVTFSVRADDGDLLPVGKAYTGLTDAEIAEMTSLLLEQTIDVAGSYHAVAPLIVLEVAFDSVQPSTRHRGGYALRFPRIVAWRRDKSVEDIDSLDRVRTISEARARDFDQLIERGGSTPGS